jgi:hypothetical protein
MYEDYNLKIDCQIYEDLKRQLSCNHYIKCFCLNQNVASKNTNNFYVSYENIKTKYVLAFSKRGVIRRKIYLISSFSPFFLSLRGLFIGRKQILEAHEFLEKSEVSLLV